MALSVSRASPEGYARGPVLSPSALPLLLVGTAYFALFGPVLVGLLRDWAGSGEYGHGFLLLPVAGYLAWRDRPVEPDPRGKDRVLGGVILVGAVGIFLAGTVAVEFFTRRLAALLAAFGLVVYFLGFRQGRRWWLPFCLLLFTIPLPEVVLNSLTLPLQLFASETAVGLLRFRHVPVDLSGNIILLPGGRQLFVAEACSGLRSVSALLGLTVLIAGTTLRAPVWRWVLVLLAIPAALATNAFRVFATGYAVYFLGPAAAEGPVHEAAGAIVFLLALAVLGVVAVGLKRLER